MRRFVLFPSALLVLFFACSKESGNTGFTAVGGAASATSVTSTTGTGATSTGTTTTSTTGTGATSTGTTTTSSSTSGGPVDGGILHPCELPGSVQYTGQATPVVVPGGSATWPDLTFLNLPPGFCAHYYGTVGNARQLRFAPGGELFVASPTGPTTGGNAQAGQSAIMVLPDDTGDGVADTNLTFLGSLPETQGLMFIPGFFYYQEGTQIMRVPYATGDRTPSGPPSPVVNITYYSDSLHWPKTLDMADDGTIYIGNGGSQSDQCITPHPFKGGIRSVTATTIMATDGTPVAQGFRNPIAVRCLQGHNTCFSLELALDYSSGQGGREKMVPIRTGDDWGFPCCASQNVSYADVDAGTSCAAVAPDTVSWLIGDTPFGLAFAPSSWPGMWSGAAIVTTHGAAGSWVGARIVAVAMDPTTGLPMAGTDNFMPAHDQGSMTDFATGWDDGMLAHGRPAAVDFSADGRLFVANDNNGVIFWIAPLDM
jgi:glucose/arabinose dehydrogenase